LGPKGFPNRVLGIPIWGIDFNWNLPWIGSKKFPKVLPFIGPKGRWGSKNQLLKRGGGLGKGYIL